MSSHSTKHDRLKVLLISPNREHLPDPVYPLGLAYVAAALKNRGDDVQVLDLCFSDDPDSAVREAAQSFTPDVVGISLRNIDDVAYPRCHSYLQDYRETVAAVRRHSDARIVLGGSGFTIMPEAFMRELNADFGIVGEGEEAFPELIGKLSNGRLPLKSGTIIRAGRRIREIGSTEPDRALFNSAEYYRLGGMLNIQTKRGCSFRCSYCTYPLVEGRRVRVRSACSVAVELEQIIERTGARHFFFVDSIFNHPESHARAVCEEIIRRRIDIQWSCYATPAHMTEELAAIMVKAGCTGVEFGVDSLVDEILGNLGKSITFRRIKKASEACLKEGLKFCHFVFAGAPGDTDSTVHQTIDRLDELNPDAAVVMAGIRIFPGTGLAERAGKELGIGKIGLDPIFYLSPGVRDYDKIRDEISRRRNWVMPGYEVNMRSLLQRKLREEHGVKGPLWRGLSKRK